MRWMRRYASTKPITKAKHGTAVVSIDHIPACSLPRTFVNHHAVDFAAFSIHCWGLYGRFSSHGLAPGGISLRSSSQLTEKDMSSTTAVHIGTYCFLFPNVRSRLLIIYVSRPIKMDEVARLLERLQAGRAVFPDQASYEDERD